MTIIMNKNKTSHLISSTLILATTLTTVFYQAHVTRGLDMDSPIILDIPTLYADQYCLKAHDSLYCADTEANLVEAIRTNWDDTPDEFNPPEPTPIPIAPAEPSYTFHAWDDDIASIVYDEAAKQGYNDPDLVLRLIDCESRFNPKAVNSRGNYPAHSVDRGILQYNDYWQRNNISEACAFDPRCAIAKGIEDLKAGKASQWACYRLVK